MHRHAALRIPCQRVKGISKVRTVIRPLRGAHTCISGASLSVSKKANCRSPRSGPRSCSTSAVAAESIKGRSRFTNFEDAISWHQQVQWESSYLDPFCVDVGAFRELSRRYGWTFSINLWHRVCLLACLGVELPKIIRLISDRNMQFWVKPSITIEKLKYLHDVLGMKRAVLAKLCTTHPRLLEYSLENTIKSRAAFFCEYFQIEPADLGLICAKHPRMLWAHMDLDIKAKIQLLNGVMGDPEDVVSMLRRQPSILAYSEVTIQEKLCALVELLELQPGELAQVLRRSPSLLNRNVESLRPQLRTLLQHLRDPSLVSSVIRSYSQALTYSPKTLHVKLLALRNDFGISPQMIATNPSLIGYSTEGRVRPRVHRLRALLGAFKEGRRMLRPSPMAAPPSEADKTKRKGCPKKLGSKPSATGDEGADGQKQAPGHSIWTPGRLAGFGRESNAGKFPDSGVPGISEDAVVMAYMLAVSDEQFEHILNRYERRSTRRAGREPARKRPGVKT